MSTKQGLANNEVGYMLCNIFKVLHDNCPEKDFEDLKFRILDMLYDKYSIILSLKVLEDVINGKLEVPEKKQKSKGKEGK